MGRATFRIQYPASAIQHLRQHHIMLTILIIFFYGIDHRLQMFFISQEISIGSIHNQGCDTMLPDIVSVCILYIQ